VVEGRVRQAGQARVIGAAHHDLRQALRVAVVRLLFHGLSLARLHRDGAVVLLVVIAPMHRPTIEGR
jgi:hypothetical protein